MNGEDSPYDRDALEALASERGAVVAPLEAQKRVRARLRGSIAGLGHSGGGPAGGGRGRGSSALRLARPLSYVIPLVLGGILGVFAGRATVAPPPPRVVYVDRYVDREVAAPPGAPTVPSASISTEQVHQGSAPTPPRGSATSTDAHAGTLAVERALVDVAHTALVRGDADGALAALAKHERRFPAGALREEREAIAVQALVLARRFEEARARGSHFHERFPDSLLGAAVDEALGSIPR